MKFKITSTTAKGLIFYDFVEMPSAESAEQYAKERRPDCISRDVVMQDSSSSNTDAIRVVGEDLTMPAVPDDTRAPAVVEGASFTNSSGAPRYRVFVTSQKRRAADITAIIKGITFAGRSIPVVANQGEEGLVKADAELVDFVCPSCCRPYATVYSPFPLVFRCRTCGKLASIEVNAKSTDEDDWNTGAIRRLRRAYGVLLAIWIVSAIAFFIAAGGILTWYPDQETTLLSFVIIFHILHTVWAIILGVMLYGCMRKVLHYRAIGGWGINNGFLFLFGIPTVRLFLPHFDPLWIVVWVVVFWWCDAMVINAVRLREMCDLRNKQTI